MTTVDQYKASRFLSVEIRNHLNKWGAPIGFYKDFKRANSIYSLKEPENENFIRGLADIGLSYRDAFVDYLKVMESSIRSLRFDMKRTVSYAAAATCIGYLPHRSKYASRIGNV